MATEVDDKVVDKEKDVRITSAEERPTLREIIEEKGEGTEVPVTSSLSFLDLLGGEYLNTSTIRRQIGLITLIAIILLIYIGMGYKGQKYLIEIDHLRNELQDAKYRSLSSSSQLTEKSRHSHILEMLKANKDTALHIADEPPYIISLPDK